MKIETNYYKLIPYKNILYSETFNAWDESIAKTYIEDIRKIASEKYSDKSWAILVDRRKWDLHTPDAEKYFIKILSGKAQTPLKHIAVVSGISEIKKWQMNNIKEKMTEKTGEIFENLEDAMDWLASFGYDVPSSCF